NEHREITVRQLLLRCRRILGHLGGLGLRQGDTLLIAVDDVSAFVETFWTCILGGVVAVPLAAPANAETALKLLQIAAQHNRPWLVADADIGARLDEAMAKGGEHGETFARLLPRLVDYRTIPDDGVLGDPAPVNESDLAFLQYSSGSTGAPKGVMLTHANLVVNVAGLVKGYGADAFRRAINWMPLSHDLGLILFHITPLVFGYDQCQIPSRLFLRSPQVWMEASSRFYATALGGPNFAFRHMLKTYRPEKPYGWDLSSIQTIVNAAEPIDVDLMREFVRLMVPHGLRPEAMNPCYGLAEATVGVAVNPAMSGAATIAVDRRALSVGDRVVPLDAEDAPDRLELAIVGYPLHNIGVRFVDDDGAVLPEHTVGRLQIKGPSVTCGYFANAQATREVLGEDGWLDTGDLGFYTGGRVVITGRSKDIIIIDGVNFYPHDIERVASGVAGLDLNMVAATSVRAADGRREAVAMFIVHRKSTADFAPLVRRVRERVSRDMGIAIDHCIAVPRLPKTTSGKIRRFVLAEQFAAGAFDRQLTELAAAMADHYAPMRQCWLDGDTARLCALLSEDAALLLPDGRIDPGCGLMEQGFTSLRLVELGSRITHALGLSLPSSFLFDHPTLEAAAAALTALRPHALETVVPESALSPQTAPTPAGGHSGAIAVLGMACRFPGAPSTEAFWDLLRNGGNAITPVPAERGWNLAVDPLRNLPGSSVTDRGGWLSKLDLFDAPLFGVAPGEAEELDPQQRLLLELAWTALEDAAIDPRRLAGRQVGVFAGLATGDWAQAHLRAGNLPAIGPYAVTGSAGSIASGRLSFALGLHGPNLSVDTSCSSSLVATHLAVRALRAGECDLALVGGVNLMLSPEVHVAMSAMGALSPDGLCRSFDAGANGYVRGEGCAVLVLKPLDAARADGDPVLCVIEGTAINHDGASTALTAPNGEAQQAVLRQALADAGITSGDVDYIETHGTGTPLGDPIEVSALAAVLGHDRDPADPLLIGSVKSNIGHLETAAGLAGIIKVILALRHQTIPASLHVAQPNPRLDWDKLPIRIATQVQPWP
ncbi:MAG: AMP-binding protein, partial [Alphaproteobacteria bacterium]|nr:AMP-binding protein [Alphaproteobacteria bacterium]